MNDRHDRVRCGAGRARKPVFPALAALTPTAPVALTVYEYATLEDAPTSLNDVAVEVPTGSTVPLRKIWYPVAPIDATHVTETWSGEVPSEAATPVGAERLRYPVSPLLAALIPSVP